MCPQKIQSGDRGLQANGAFPSIHLFSKLKFKRPSHLELDGKIQLRLWRERNLIKLIYFLCYSGEIFRRKHIEFLKIIGVQNCSLRILKIFHLDNQFPDISESSLQTIWFPQLWLSFSNSPKILKSGAY